MFSIVAGTLDSSKLKSQMNRRFQQQNDIEMPQRQMQLPQRGPLIPAMPKPRSKQPIVAPPTNPLPPIAFKDREPHRAVQPQRNDPFKINRPGPAFPPQSRVQTPRHETRQNPFTPGTTNRVRNPFRDAFMRKDNERERAPEPMLEQRQRFEEPDPFAFDRYPKRQRFEQPIEELPQYNDQFDTRMDDVNVQEDEDLLELERDMDLFQPPQIPEPTAFQSLPPVPRAKPTPTLILARHLSESPIWKEMCAKLTKDQTLKVRIGERTPANPVDASIIGCGVGIVVSEGPGDDEEILGRFVDFFFNSRSQLIMFP